MQIAPLERRLKQSVGVLLQPNEIMRCLEIIWKTPLGNHGRGFLPEWSFMPPRQGGREVITAR